MRDLFQSLRTLQEDPNQLHMCNVCSTMLQRIPTGGNRILLSLRSFSKCSTRPGRPKIDRPVVTPSKVVVRHMNTSD